MGELPAAGLALSGASWNRAFRSPLPSPPPPAPSLAVAADGCQDNAATSQPGLHQLLLPGIWTPIPDNALCRSPGGEELRSGPSGGAPLHFEGAVDKDWEEQPPAGYLKYLLFPFQKGRTASNLQTRGEAC